ncbi:unnamed protein product [Durusdinium trenchii]|uniref:Uncharacterized protein n=2 Tax=Durusdinium trenchii TaxID=1381693 RepID=A0ABP0P5I0_9DINO
METCVACLLHTCVVQPGQLMQPARMLQLLDSPDAGPLLQYLSWLEEALKEITNSSTGRTVLVPQRAFGALKSWPAERSLLRQSAEALWEAITVQGPQHLRHAQAWNEALQQRQEIQKRQTEECQRVAQELHETASFFLAQVDEHSGGEWPKLARVTQDSLMRVQQVAEDLFNKQKDCWQHALEDYEALNTKATNSRAAVQEVRRQVRRHEQAFGQAAQRFTEVANQLVAWTSLLVPKLRLLEAQRAHLRAAVEIRQTLPALEREYLHAEDELDTAQTELRKQKRRLQASSSRRRPASSPDATTAGYVLEHQCELRVAHAQKRVDDLQEQLREAEKRLQEAETSLPMELGPHEEESGGTSSSGVQPDAVPVDPHLTNEERLALKLATLQQFHEEMVALASESQAEHDKMLRKVEQRKVQAALKQAVEPDFMMGRARQNYGDDDEGILAAIANKVLGPVRGCLGMLHSSRPPEPAVEVVELLQDMKITPRLVIQFHKIFKRLKQTDAITLRVGPNEVSTASMTRLVKNHRKWVAKILILLLDLAGFKDTVTWDGFLYVTMQFCSLSKLELCQVMFYIVSKEMRSWTVHYVTSSQLQEFYDDYYTCPVAAFNTNSIGFAKLPLAKYRMQDFIELCYRFSQLINPCMHLQRSLQQSLGSLRYWCNFDRVKVYNRKINIDFFRYQKVTTILELMQRQAGVALGPIQQHRLAMSEHFLHSIDKSSPGFKDDLEKFKATVLRALEVCRPVRCGVLPIPTLGVKPPTKTKLQREVKLPKWMTEQLEQNFAPGLYGGHSLGHALQLEWAKREKVPPSLDRGPDMPKSVEEAERLIRSTFGATAAWKATTVRQIAAELFLHAAKPPSEDNRMKAVIRSQEMEFIRMSRDDHEPPNLVTTMFRLFQEELIHRTEEPDPTANLNIQVVRS